MADKKPAPTPIVVSDATLRRLIATGGRIEAPARPPATDAERAPEPARPVQAA